MVQEHERAVGGWQAEWATVQAMLQSAGVALEAMAEVAEGLTVDAARMRHNIDATQGAVFAEKAMMLLAPEIGREAAHRAVQESVRHIRLAARIAGTARSRRTTWAARRHSACACWKRRNSVPFADSEGCRIYYRLEGVAGRPLLVLAHSLGADHGMWDPQMPALLSRFQVLRLDLRGHGASDVTPGDYTIAQLAHDVLAAVDAAGRERFAFCGLSLGGMIGQWLGAHAGARVERLVLANTSSADGRPQLSSRRAAPPCWKRECALLRTR